MENKLKEVIAAVLGISEEKVKDNSSSDNIESWDSLKQMNLIVVIEEQFGVEFDEEETILLNSYKLLLDSIKCKLKC